MEEDQTMLARNQPECMLVLLVYGESQRKREKFYQFENNKNYPEPIKQI
jgi:hypothetical protein